MKSFDELLNSLPEKEELSSEEKEKILALAMGKINQKPKIRQKKIWYAASIVAACLVFVSVIAVPFATQKKNVAQDSVTESAAPPQILQTEPQALEETVQASRTEDSQDNEKSIVTVEDTAGAAEKEVDIAQEETETYSVVQTEEAREESVAFNDAQMDYAAIVAPETAAPEIAEEAEPDTYVTADTAEENAVMESTSSKFSGGSGGGSSAVRREVITDNESYQSVKHIARGEISYENTHKTTNRVLTLRDFFPEGYDYKKELSLTGEELFYITPDNHLVIITDKGEIDIGVLIDGKIKK